MNGIILRPGRKEDCKGIRDLIQRLVESSNLSDAPTIDADVLERDGFGDKPLFHSFVAEENDNLIGYITYSFQYLTWTGRSIHLSNIYVIPDARNKGVGSLLFDAVAKEAVDENCTSLTFLVLEGSPAIDFYKRKGAVNLTETHNYHAYLVNEKTLKELSTKSKDPEN